MEITDENLNKVPGNVFREKQINAEISDKQIREKRELYVSVIYNSFFWIFFISGIALLASCKTMPGDLPTLTAGIVCLCLGFIFYAFNIGRFGEDETYNYSMVREYLENYVSKEQFVELMQRRDSGSPKIVAQISMKENIKSVAKHKEHWSRKHRETWKEITYGSYTGKSFDTKTDVPWPREETATCKIIVKKLFKVRDEASNIIFKAQAEDFCKVHRFEENSQYLHFEYLLGFQNERSIPPLVEAFLVSSSEKQSFFSITLYKTLTYVSLDSIYRLIFMLKTKDLGIFEIEKTVKHFESQA